MSENSNTLIFLRLKNLIQLLGFLLKLLHESIYQLVDAHNSINAPSVRTCKGVAVIHLTLVGVVESQHNAVG